MGFSATAKQTFEYASWGCKPHIRIKRDYAPSGKSCSREDIIASRTDFVIPAPIVDQDGSCTAPPV